jgi:hypothetical protein
MGTTELYVAEDGSTPETVTHGKQHFILYFEHVSQTLGGSLDG